MSAYSMPKLSDMMKPGQAEIDAAKKLLDKASKEEARSKMACFSAWAKKNGVEDVSAMRGADRKNGLLIYMAYMGTKKRYSQNDGDREERDVFDGEGQAEGLDVAGKNGQ